MIFLPDREKTIAYHNESKLCWRLINNTFVLSIESDKVNNLDLILDLVLIKCKIVLSSLTRDWCRFFGVWQTVIDIYLQYCWAVCQYWTRRLTSGKSQTNWNRQTMAKRWANSNSVFWSYLSFDSIAIQNHATDSDYNWMYWKYRYCQHYLCRLVDRLRFRLHLIGSIFRKISSSEVDATPNPLIFNRIGLSSKSPNIVVNSSRFSSGNT